MVIAGKTMKNNLIEYNQMFRYFQIMSVKRDKDPIVNKYNQCRKLEFIRLKMIICLR